MCWLAYLFWRSCSQHPGYDRRDREVQGIWLCQLWEARRCPEGQHACHVILLASLSLLSFHVNSLTVLILIVFVCFCRLWTKWMAKNWMADKCTWVVRRRRASVRMSSNESLNRWNKIAWPDTRYVSVPLTLFLILWFSKGILVWKMFAVANLGFNFSSLWQMWFLLSVFLLITLAAEINLLRLYNMWGSV